MRTCGREAAIDSLIDINPTSKILEEAVLNDSWSVRHRMRQGWNVGTSDFFEDLAE